MDLNEKQFTDNGKHAGQVGAAMAPPLINHHDASSHVYFIRKPTRSTMMVEAADNPTTLQHTHTGNGNN
jgi:hypothetical protein